MNKGTQAKFLRLMGSLLILKHLRNLSDECIVEQCAENVYCLYFSDEQIFTSRPPCLPPSQVEFRIGVAAVGGIEEESLGVQSF